ncbi:MAG TPA: hypothetical protein VMK12_27230 [Anaeromyxobacteraceae bacterium]|nr:hypothetical protein [Anaeromyxobacteraceae bacterium]
MPEQLSLLDVAAPPDSFTCRRCGRSFPGMMSGRGLRLDVLLSLPEEDRRPLLACWLGKCGGKNA